MSTREEVQARVEETLLGAQLAPDKTERAVDAIMEMIEDAHVNGAVEGLKTYAQTLDEASFNAPIGSEPVVTVRGVAKALRISAGRIHRNYEDGKLLAALDPDGELDSGGHDS